MFLLSSFLKPTDQIQSKTAEWPWQLNSLFPLPILPSSHPTSFLSTGRFWSISILQRWQWHGDDYVDTGTHGQVRRARVSVEYAADALRLDRCCDTYTHTHKMDTYINKENETERERGGGRERQLEQHVTTLIRPIIFYSVKQNRKYTTLLRKINLGSLPLLLLLLLLWLHSPFQIQRNQSISKKKKRRVKPTKTNWMLWIQTRIKKKRRSGAVTHTDTHRHTQTHPPTQTHRHTHRETHTHTQTHTAIEIRVGYWLGRRMTTSHHR